MAPLAARRLAEMVELGEALVAVELVISCQAVDLRQPERLGAGTRKALERLREVVPFLVEGEPLAPDLEPVRQLIRSRALTAS
jgi:histidine ammonia-lyase